MNKFENFASEMSIQLFEIRIKDLNNFMLFDDNMEQIPIDFIDAILDENKHAEQIKEQIRLSVLEDVTQHPDEYDMNCDEYVYSGNIYSHSFIIDRYIENQYHDDNPIMVNVHVCDFCGSNNVQTKVWVRPNNNNEYVDMVSEEINDNYCDDCDQNTTLSVVEKNERHDVIGFQVWGDDGTTEENIHHHYMNSEKEVYTLNQANSMMDDTNNEGDEQWQLHTIWTTDIEKPEFMFKGDPRN